MKQSTLVLKVNPKKPDDRILTYAAAGIRYGTLVAFPTETVYGLAANRDNARAVTLLYKTKRRPRSKALTILIADTGLMRKLGCVMTKEARALTKKYWPGPLTIILRSRTGRKIGFRMPANRIACELLRKADVPVVAPSANLSGMPAPTNAQAVLRGLDGKIDMLIDGGKTRVGVESTVVDCAVKEPRILREGAISCKSIERVLCRA